MGLNLSILLTYLRDNEPVLSTFSVPQIAIVNRIIREKNIPPAGLGSTPWEAFSCSFFFLRKPRFMIVVVVGRAGSSNASSS